MVGVNAFFSGLATEVRSNRGALDLLCGDQGESGMKKIIGVYTLATLFAFGLGGLNVARAEVGPVSTEQLTSEAALVANGRVTRVLENDVVNGEFTVAHFTITVRATNIEKGSLPPGETEFYFTGGFVTLHKPDGFVGRLITLRDHLSVGDRIKVYLKPEGDHWQMWHYGCVVLDPRTESLRRQHLIPAI